MAKTVLIRQGDVLLRKVEELPEGLQESKRQMAAPGLITLAFGEATGHHHSIRKAEGLCLLESETEDEAAREVFLSIMNEKGATLTHQEHAALTIPAGNYRVTLQREYTPEMIRQVID